MQQLGKGIVSLLSLIKGDQVFAHESCTLSDMILSFFFPLEYAHKLDVCLFK